ncbi:MAG: hypothetical protein ING66_13385 [Rhodocyclaceae bacterium]|nr:hypothetical protein [Rhodocyclaceae bacterium]MCA3039519.1 hypothetical protein [Rhodocyclaceae bacterium]MCA3057845.1 hypothetical protein [Rhodocyclaceae bacterium]MCA3063191.1 hypothetical protein [Rhodocyclaceae bacterium]MCA3080448.1 hypothetical protein [Rhodocyclaceae bacterium]
MSRDIANSRTNQRASRTSIWTPTFEDADLLAAAMRDVGRNPDTLIWHVGESPLDVLLTSSDGQIADSRAIADVVLKRYFTKNAPTARHSF